MTDSHDDLVAYRLEKARQTLGDARVLANAGRWNACVNRLYYACFYAVSALLLKDGLSATKHTGIRSLLNRHYVKTGRIPRHMAQIYNDLFERRQESDYTDFMDFRESQVAPWIFEAEKFVEYVIHVTKTEKGAE